MIKGIARRLAGAWGALVKGPPGYTDTSPAPISTYDDLWNAIKAPTKKQLIDAYRGAVYACANINATAFAAVPLRLYVTVGRGQPEPKCPHAPVTKSRSQWLRCNKSTARRTAGLEIREVTDHPMLDLLELVSDELDGYQLAELTDLYQEIVGTAYWWLPKNALGVPGMLWVLLPQLTEPIRNKNGDIIKYKYGWGNGAKELPADEVVSFKFPNLEDPYGEGISPARALWMSLSIQNRQYGYMSSVLDNRARADMMFSVQDGISEEEALRMEEAIYKKLRKRRSGGILVLPENVRGVPLQFPPKDLEMLAMHGVTKVDLANGYNVPMSLLETKEVPRANVDGGLYQHAKFAVLPRCRRHEMKLNQRVCPMFDSRLFVAFDNPVPEDHKMDADIREIDLRTGHKTINETRIEDGLEPVEWGDRPWLPMAVSQVGAGSGAPASPFRQDDEEDDEEDEVEEDGSDE